MPALPSALQAPYSTRTRRPGTPRNGGCNISLPSFRGDETVKTDRTPKSASPAAATGTVALLVATRKGAFILRSDRARRTWNIAGPMFFGHIVHHMVLDPARAGARCSSRRAPATSGPTVFRSTDFGKTWKEAAKPPAFPKAPEGQKGRVVDHTFWLTPGHASEPGVWYAGTSPQGLFRSEDGGDTWAPVSGLQRPSDVSAVDRRRAGRHARRTEAAFDHRRPARCAPSLHRHVERRRVREHGQGGRAGSRSTPGCRADFLPDPYPEYGHDPHCVRLHPAGARHALPAEPLRHLPHGARRREVGAHRRRACRRRSATSAFPIVLHPRDPDTAWVFPMDGSIGVAAHQPGGKPAAYVTRNAGTTLAAPGRGAAARARAGSR